MKSPRLFLARTLLPMVAPPLDDGALCVRNGRLVAVGHRREMMRQFPDAAVTDFGDAILLPPLINAHTHLELTNFPDWATAAGETRQADSFVDWILKVVKVKRTLPREAYATSLAEGIRRSLQAGTGAVGDILSHFPARQAYAGSPLRGRIFLELLGRTRDRFDPLLTEANRILGESPVGHPGYGLSPHSPYTLDAEYLRQSLDLGRQQSVPVMIHLAESAEESAFFRDLSGPLAQRFYPLAGWGNLLPPAAGVSPVAYLQRLGGLHPGVLLVHGVQVDDSDIQLIARSGARVVLCPRSNARLEVGRAPLDKYLAAGLLPALGSDSLASNGTLSIWDELAFARSWFGAAVSPQQLLEMAILGGSHALDLQGEMGSLAAGWGAHFQVLRPTSRPAPAEMYDYLCSGCGADLFQLVLDGR
ncbi:amidohydrolase family protein [Desulfuromonas carbonis]